MIRIIKKELNTATLVYIIYGSVFYFFTFSLRLNCLTHGTSRVAHDEWVSVKGSARGGGSVKVGWVVLAVNRKFFGEQDISKVEKSSFLWALLTKWKSFFSLRLFMKLEFSREDKLFRGIEFAKYWLKKFDKSCGRKKDFAHFSHSFRQKVRVLLRKFYNFSKNLSQSTEFNFLHHSTDFRSNSQNFPSQDGSEAPVLAQLFTNASSNQLESIHEPIANASSSFLSSIHKDGKLLVEAVQKGRQQKQKICFRCSCAKRAMKRRSMYGE